MILSIKKLLFILLVLTVKLGYTINLNAEELYPAYLIEIPKSTESVFIADIENAKLIADYSGNIKEFLDIVSDKKIDQYINIDGIGETQINSIKNFFKNKDNFNIVSQLSNILSIKSIKRNKKGKLKNKTFMFTGKLIDISRAEAKNLTEQNLGNIVSTVSKKLNYLVIGEKPTQKKIELAKKVGVKILTQQEWNNLLN